MKKKVNLAELLKNCPHGMELDCTMYDNLYFKCVRGHAIYPIVCYTVDSKGEKHETSFNWYGKHTPIDTAKCAIFPKGKTTWEGFVPPFKFKDGDVLTYMFYNKPTIYIYRENGSCNTSYYAGYSLYNERFYKTPEGGLCGDRADLRLATEEEKQKLFKAIKDNGYRWNAETKTLEELVEPKFHKGDWITNGDYTWKIVEVKPLGYILQSQDGNIVDDTISHVDEQFHSFTIEDAKDGDVLTINWYGGYDYWEKIIIFKEYHNTDVGGHVEGYGNTFKNGKLAFNEEVPYYSKTWTRNLKPANKEQRELLFQKIKEAGYRWNEETKTLEELTRTKFKPGDVLVSDLGNMVLLSHIDSENIVHYHCIITTYNSFRIEENTAVGVGKCYDCVLANEQQRQRMYDKIKISGYKYNQTTNKLEKMDEPEFKDGDIVFSGKDLISIFKKLSPSKSLHSYVSIMHNGCLYVDGDLWTSDNMRLATEGEKEKLFNAMSNEGYKWDPDTKTLLTVPMFKAGDMIKRKDGSVVHTIKMIDTDLYVFDDLQSIPIIVQGDYELVPKKFDVNTLKPFDRVLVRSYDSDEWRVALWGHLKEKHDMRYDTTRGTYRRCIPYEGNEHLLGKTGNCDDYYKTW